MMALVFLEINDATVASRAAREIARVGFKAVDTSFAFSGEGYVGVNCCRWGSRGRGSLRWHVPVACSERVAAFEFR